MDYNVMLVVVRDFNSGRIQFFKGIIKEDKEAILYYANKCGNSVYYMGWEFRSIGANYFTVKVFNCIHKFRLLG